MTPERGAGVGFRLATRLARREVRRRPGRTLLVALLVAVPVAGMLVADVMVRTEHGRPIDRWRSEHGLADAVVYTAQPASNTEVDALLAKSRVVVGSTYVENRLLRTVDAHRSNATISYLAWREPMTRGIVQLTSGRAPRRDNEVFLTRRAARDLHVAVGQTLRLERPAVHEFTVTGVGERAAQWGDTTMILPYGSPYPWKTRVTSSQSSELFVDLPDDVQGTELERLRVSADSTGFGLQISPALVAQRQEHTVADTRTKVRWSWVIGALVLTVAGIVIAAAFAAGARRQLVTLGQLAANGASPGVLRRVLFLQGTWTGIAGGIGGVGLGAIALAALAPHVDRLMGRDVHPYIVSFGDLVPILALGIATATIAALLPARTTSRIPVLAALSGRRPLARVPAWLPITGAVMSAGGLGLLGLAVLGARNNDSGNWQVWALTAIVGGVSVLLGVCAIAPAYVSVLEPAAKRAHGAGRIAMRSLARQRTRTGAVVSAVAAAGALAIAVSSLMLGATAHDLDALPYMRDDEVQIAGNMSFDGVAPPPTKYVDAVARALPGATRFQVLAGSRPDLQWSVQTVVPDHAVRRDEASINDVPSIGAVGAVAIADRTAFDVYELTRRDRERLADQGALYLGPSDGIAVFASVGYSVNPATPIAPPRTFEAAMTGGRYLTGGLPRLLLTPTRAKQLGMVATESTVVLRTPHALTRDERNLVADIGDEAYDDMNDAGPDLNNFEATYISFSSPSSHVDPLLVDWILVGVALVLVLFVVAVNLALSATETRDERDALTVVGASPASMQRASGYKAVLLTVMGTVLAIPVGFLPVAVFMGADNRTDLPLVFPWRVVALLVVALPIVAGIVTTAASGAALRLRPVRISTMAFD